MRVVTISATYGAGGGLIGPTVADRLGVPFVDRAIPAAVAQDLGVPLEDVLGRDDQARGRLGRMLAAAAPLSAEWMVNADQVRGALLSDAEVLSCTEEAIRRAVRGGGAVILGRAAALVLRGHPQALHVRLDGDPDRRVAQAATVLGIGEPQARRAMARNDKARTAYVRHFYGEDPADLRHYHLVMDSTRLPLEVCTALVVEAALARAGPPPSPYGDP